MAMGMRVDPPRGIVARFNERLSGREMKQKASTYLVFVVIGFAMAASGVAVLGLIYRDPEDLLWILHGLVVGLLFSVPTVYVDSAGKRSSWKEDLALLTIFLMMLPWLVIVAAPMVYTHEGEVLLAAFYVAWMLGWAGPGIIYYRYKLAVEHGLADPPQVVKRGGGTEALHGPQAMWETQAQKYQNRAALVFMSSVLIATSAGIMIYGALGMIADPGANDMHTLEDWSGMIVWLVPMLASLIVLALGILRGELRLMLLAGMLSGFSYLGVFAVAGEILLWFAHRRYGLPWKRGEPPETDESGVIRTPYELQARRTEELAQLDTMSIGFFRSYRENLVDIAAKYGVGLEVDTSSPGTLQEEVAKVRKDIESFVNALESERPNHPRRHSRILKKLRSDLEATEMLVASSESARPGP